MTFIQTFTIVASSATIFALIVGIFGVWNGRMTRKEIGNLIKESSKETQNLIKETQNLIKESSKETQKLIIETRELTLREMQAWRTLMDKMEEQAEQRHKEVIELLKK